VKKIISVFPLFPSENNVVNVWDPRYMFRTNICSEKYYKTRYELRIKWAKITDTNHSEILTFTEFKQNALCSFKVTDCNVAIVSSVYECTLREHITHIKYPGRNSAITYHQYGRTVTQKRTQFAVQEARTQRTVHQDEHNGTVQSTSRLLQFTTVPNFLLRRIHVRSKCFHHTAGADT
jgi:hypothetical protein